MGLLVLALVIGQQLCLKGFRLTNRPRYLSLKKAGSYSIYSFYYQIAQFLRQKQTSIGYTLIHTHACMRTCMQRPITISIEEIQEKLAQDVMQWD